MGRGLRSTGDIAFWEKDESPEIGESMADVVKLSFGLV